MGFLGQWCLGFYVFYLPSEACERMDIMAVITAAVVSEFRGLGFLIPNKNSIFSHHPLPTF